MESIVSNAGAVRRETLHGREYLVAPATLIVSDRILSGSEGPGFYPGDEVERDPAAWNIMPLVVYHPCNEQGEPISARDPKILAEQQVGNVFRSAGGGRLESEAWFDVELTARADNKFKNRQGYVPILPKLLAEEPIELSTGVFPDYDFTPGTFNGEDYDWVARNLRPDHVAVLPGQIGACSNEMGCGININERQGVLDKLAVLLGIKKPEDNCGGPGSGVPGPCPGPKAGKGEGATKGSAGAKPSAVADAVVSKMRELAGPANVGQHKKGFKEKLSAEMKSGMAQLDQAASSAKTAAEKKEIEEARDRIRSYVRVFNRESTMSVKTKFDRKKAEAFLTANCDCFKGDKAKSLTGMADDQIARLADNARLVLVVNEYKKGGLSALKRKKADNAEDEVAGVDIAALAEFLGVAADPASDPVGFVAELKGILDEVSARLGASAPPAEPAAMAQEVEPTPNASEEPTPNEQIPAANRRVPVAKPPTEKQWLEAAPAPIRNRLKRLEQNEERQRLALINELVAAAPEANQAQLRKLLANKSIEELEERQLMLGAVRPKAPTANEDRPRFWFGGGPPAANRGPDQDDDEGGGDDDEIAMMTTPVMNFERRGKDAKKATA